MRDEVPIAPFWKFIKNSLEVQRKKVARYGSLIELGYFAHVTARPNFVIVRSAENYLNINQIA